MIEEESARRARLKTLRQHGIDPYPSDVERSHTIKEFLAHFEEFEDNQTSVTLVGRLRTIRKHGGLTFANLEDGSGTVQLAFQRNELGEDDYDFLHETLDMGDFIQITGTAFVTRKGEQTLDATEYDLTTKTLLPLPEKWHGLTDTEARYRQRYLDLLSNESVKAKFRVRAKILKTMRDYLDQHGFLEVETPILQHVPGGANAKPFKTHHNALDSDMYLRIAPELFLKRCIVGGFERVYEVARCFRNEGIDHSHNPEFTQVEGYVAYMDYEAMMEFMEEMIVEVIKACGLDVSAVPYEGEELDFSTPWKRMTYRDALLSYADVDIEKHETREEFAEVAKDIGVPVATGDSKGTIIDNIYKHTVRPKIVQPTYLVDYPVELSPLAKRKRDDMRYVEMFQLVYGKGVENVKAFSELNDPIDQAERFEEQRKAREAGDDEAQFADDAYVEALKHGMPPTAGFGVGIDRLAATLTDSHNLKEVIMFPALKPKNEAQRDGSETKTE